MTRVAVALVLLAACASDTTPPESPRLSSGWHDVDREALHTALTEPSGRVRVVNFWATWCGPCLAEMPHLTAWAAANPAVELIFVSVDHPSVRARGDSVLTRHNIADFAVMHLDSPDPDTDLGAAVAGWTSSVPLTVVVSPAGERLATYPYAIEGAQLDAALAGAR